MWSGRHADSRLRVWLLIAAATVALRLPLLVQPFFFAQDEATYSALAVRLLAGATPYATAVDHKPPGAELTYAAAYAIAGGHHILAVHVLLLAIVAATSAVIAEVAAAVAGPGARIAGVLYAIASTLGPPGDTQAANTELLLNLPIAIAAWLAALGIGNAKAAKILTFLVAGMLTAVAGLFKYQASLFGIAWAAAVVWERPSRRFAFVRLAALALGFAAVAALYCAWFWRHGVWDAFTFWGWRFNFSYINDLDVRLKAWNALYYTALTALLWSPLVVLIASGLRAHRPAPLVVAWLLAGAAAASVGGRFFPHYYLMALPPIAILAGGSRLLQRQRHTETLGSGSSETADLCASVSLWQPSLAHWLAVVLLAASVGASTYMAWRWLDLKDGLRRHHEAYVAVGDYIRSHSTPDDTLFVWGNSAPIYYYADRVMGTRFPFTNYQTGMIWGTPNDTSEDVDTSALVVPRAWTELLEDLDRTPPAIVVDAGAGHLDRFDRHPMTRYPELARRLERYRRETVIDGVVIYRRR